ncbi:hypothetical protein R1flu_001751 [Riccia fluitans]|uniref:Secreted protein n=1 Tax=Riccia fluitans TaxID=41844 RepID=A0ABD1Y461_9MARC
MVFKIFLRKLKAAHTAILGIFLPQASVQGCTHPAYATGERVVTKVSSRRLPSIPSHFYLTDRHRGKIEPLSDRIKPAHNHRTARRSCDLSWFRLPANHLSSQAKKTTISAY